LGALKRKKSGLSKTRRSGKYERTESDRHQSQSSPLPCRGGVFSGSKNKLGGSGKTRSIKKNHGMAGPLPHIKRKTNDEIERKMKVKKGNKKIHRGRGGVSLRLGNESPLVRNFRLVPGGANRKFICIRVWFT